MDFEDTPEEAAFRAEARAFLDANAERRKPGAVEGYRRGQDAPGAMERAKDFQRRKYDAGFVGIHWPVEWGGRGGTPIQHVIYNQEEAKYDVLTGLFGIGIYLAQPTICTWGTPEQRERFVKPAMRADEVWCQLFSEPGGGSDLAALRTRAEKDGDDWVINGQKIWNSGAHYSDFGILVARSNPDVAKHEGLTFFILDMKTPGIEIRPIRQVSGSSHFNEVFFTNVRIPDSRRVGPVGAGWKVALTTLMNERHGMRDAPGPDVDELFRLAQSDRTGRRPGDRQRRGAGKAGGVLYPLPGPEIHQVPRHDGAVERPDAGSGIVDHQGRRGEQTAGHPVLRPGHDRHGRPDDGRDDAGRRHLRGSAAVFAGPAPGRRHRRDHEEHHCRTRAWPAAGPAGRQGPAVPRHPDRSRASDAHTRCTASSGRNSIAVLGASPDLHRIRGRLLHQLRENGFPGRILPINPSYQDIDGLPCYPVHRRGRPAASIWPWSPFPPPALPPRWRNARRPASRTR